MTAPQRLAPVEAPSAPAFPPSFAADGAAGWVGQSAEQWQARQEQALEACRSSVRERPMVAIGIALLAGFIVGRWLVR